MLPPDEQYMLRCLELAQKGISGAAPNPMVGAVLVHEQRIIGEGWHEQYGSPHAEVNCLQSVPETDRHLIPQSVLYVSLEPCAHYGKTPPCSELIIRNNIPKVVIGCSDPFASVNGKGIQQLKNAGITVVENVLSAECRAMNKRFFCMHTKKRPYIVLKWAQTADGFTGTGSKERLFISNGATNRLVHRWRSEESAIMVGFNTALLDDPKLDNRLWTGRTPLRVVNDPQLQLPHTLQLFNDGNKTVVFNTKRSAVEEQVYYVRIKNNDAGEMMQELLDIGIQSVLVEGGAQTHRQFIAANLWDEARIITATGLEIQTGTVAPELPVQQPDQEECILNNRVAYYFNQN